MMPRWRGQSLRKRRKVEGERKQTLWAGEKAGEGGRADASAGGHVAIRARTRLSEKIPQPDLTTELPEPLCLVVLSAMTAASYFGVIVNALSRDLAERGPRARLEEIEAARLHIGRQNEIKANRNNRDE